mmetsp:Transcript_11452/g.19368  ORF Transcript_11452/g.19368 Transcript_11452/m.19368 type:complete len:225 (-) Transcript_11452:10-684(-)
MILHQALRNSCATDGSSIRDSGEIVSFGPGRRPRPGRGGGTPAPVTLVPHEQLARREVAISSVADVVPTRVATKAIASFATLPLTTIITAIITTIITTIIIPTIITSVITAVVPSTIIAAVVAAVVAAIIVTAAAAALNGHVHRTHLALAIVIFWLKTHLVSLAETLAATQRRRVAKQVLATIVRTYEAEAFVLVPIFYHTGLGHVDDSQQGGSAAAIAAVAEA